MTGPVKELKEYMKEKRVLSNGIPVLRKFTVRRETKINSVRLAMLREIHNAGSAFTCVTELG